jgi:hypothetical protein
VGLDPVALVTRYHEALNRYDAEEMKCFFAPDARYSSVWRLAATTASTGKPYERRGTETIAFDGKGLIVSVLVEDL